MNVGRHILFLYLSLVAVSSWALGPHEILLLVNGRSPDSVEIAKEYASLRGVPERNILRLTLPGNAARPKLDISPLDFDKFIWQPAATYMKEQGMKGQILAWVYSVGFPVRVATRPPMSIQGITFLKGKVPAPESIKDALYSSPLYAGPSRQGLASHFPQSLGVYRQWLEDMPMPSMMLGYMGERGNSQDEVKRCLRRGKLSDGTAPEGVVYFITSNDIRSTCREWQFRNAVTELSVLGVKGVVTKTFPTGADPVAGLMMGAARVNPEKNKAYLAGCMAEHLTSAAAAFDAGHQTKLSAWIRHEVTATAGAVTEPYSAWEKFPNARFYVHYAAGCTVLESFFQSIKCPLQILLVGDPLAQPWAPRTQVQIDSVKVVAPGRLLVSTSLVAPAGEYYGDIRFLLDGRPVSSVEETGTRERFARKETRQFEIKEEKLPAGSHRVRAIASRAGFVRPQAFGERRFSAP